MGVRSIQRHWIDECNEMLKKEGLPELTKMQIFQIHLRRIGEVKKEFQKVPK